MATFSCMLLLAVSACLHLPHATAASSGRVTRSLLQVTTAGNIPPTDHSFAHFSFQVSAPDPSTANSQSVTAPAVTPPRARPRAMPPAYADMLAAINQYRRRHQANALGWDDPSAVLARNTARMCNLGAGVGGQSLFVSSVIPSADEVPGLLTWAASNWYDTMKNYDFNNPGYNANTGTFTQLVWRGSRNLGCAYQVCSSGIAGTPFNEGTVVVCSFLPPGNFGGASNFRSNVFPAAQQGPTVSPSPSPVPGQAGGNGPEGIAPVGTVVVSPSCWTSPDDIYKLCMQDNGNIVLFSRNQVVWSSNTTNRSLAKPYVLQVLSNGKLTATDSTGRTFWRSG